MTSVSVVMPVYNRAHVVRRALDSALDEVDALGSDAEVIVVDDGSSDDLVGALRSYGDRVSLIRHTNNGGAAAARNTGVAAAAGEYVAFLDSDDAWLSGKLAVQIEAMRKNRWPASCTAFYLSRPGLPDLVSPRYAAGPLQLRDLVWGCFVSPGSTLVFERRLFAEIGPLDTRLGRLEDWDWLLRYARRFELGFLDQPLTRVTASSYADLDPVLAAIETLRTKHLPELGWRDRTHLAAALDLARAASHFRAGDKVRAVSMLLRSWFRAPIGHVALGTVLHNRFARS
jgi:glycosyltransferase involved in cell wall biosynthesis